MKSRVVLTVSLALLSAGGRATAQDNKSEIEIRRDLQYATHDSVALKGDYYVPKRAGKYPVVIAVHGGGWQAGVREGYQFWGPFLARHGIALFSVDYRLSKPGQPTYPQAVEDVIAAIRFVKYQAAELKADPERVGMMGDSAGSHLSALIALGLEDGRFGNAYPNAPYASISARVKVVVGAYGVYDMLQQWTHDQVTRPKDQIVEKFLGKSPMDDRKIYFESSPMSYITRANNHTSFFLTWGTGDDIVDHVAQSETFLLALKQASFYVRTTPVPAAPHFWFSEPIDEPRGNVGLVAPQVLRFLLERL